MLLQQRLHRDQRHARGQHAAEPQQLVAFIGPQLRGRCLAEAVDDGAEKREQQRLERADDRSAQRHQQHVLAQAARAGPHESHEAARWHSRCVVGKRVQQFFEQGEQAQGSSGIRGE